MEAPMSATPAPQPGRRVDRLEILYDLTSAMALATSAEDVYEPALDALFRGTSCARAAILLFDADNVMRFVASRGLSDAYRQAVEGHTPWTRETRSPQPIVIQDIQKREDLRSLRDTVLREGIRGLTFIPLITEQQVIGKFMLYYDTLHVISESELRLAETIARYVAFSIERSRANERRLADAATAERRKDEFLATLAHELRNPLAAIRNGLQVLGMSQASESHRQRVHAILRRQVEQLTRLVDDLLDISRITQNKISLHKERVSIASVITDAVDTSRSLFESAGQTLTVMLPPERMEVDADPTRLAQVFWNLLSNAAKFTPSGGRVWLTVERDGSEVVMTVKDTGIGISAEQLPRIFDMFSQGAGAEERTEEGLGIGLCLARGLVGLHGGGIEARSEGPGHGSEFIVRVPLARAAGAGAAAEASAVCPSDTDSLGTLLQPHSRKPTTGTRVLVVEDNPDSADVLELMLRMAGHETQSARDGPHALTIADTFHPAVVVLDIGLPGMSGYEVARQIRKRAWAEGVLLVAVTGWGQAEDQRRAMEAGFDFHLTKPVDPEALMRLLAEARPTSSQSPPASSTP
jgi:signal transduction histidine kinase/ActR/RegA family two-component response regulator